MAKPILKLSDERDGYLLNGEFHAGFADDAALSLPQRHRIARWAQQLTPEQVSDAHLAVIGEITAKGPNPDLVRAMRRSQMLASPPVRALWATLGAEEQQHVLEPEKRLGPKARYPLSVGQLAALVGMEDQTVRRWSRARLLPSTKSPRGHREFGEAAAIMAFAMNGSKQNDREVYSDLARSEAPVKALRRSVALTTLSAFSGYSAAAREDAVRDLSGLSEQMRSFADALEQAVAKLRSDGEEAHSPGEVNVHELLAQVHLAETYEVGYVSTLVNAGAALPAPKSRQRTSRPAPTGPARLRAGPSPRPAARTCPSASGRSSSCRSS